MAGFKVVAGVYALVLAAGTALSACAQTPDANGVTLPPDRHFDFMSLPRLTGEGADGINALLTRLDDEAQANRADCLEVGRERAEWTRVAYMPFEGPRFLTVATDDSYYCGGPYPSVIVSHLTFDRRSGGVPDWATLWPGAEITADAHGAASTRAPAIVDWFRAAVRAHPETDAEWLDQCGHYYGPETREEPVAVWLDAQAGGIGMDWGSLPHADAACGSPQVVPLEVAARLGASNDLIAAVRQGHAEWAARAQDAE